MIRWEQHGKTFSGVLTMDQTGVDLPYARVACTSVQNRDRVASKIWIVKLPEDARWLDVVSSDLNRMVQVSFARRTASA